MLIKPNSHLYTYAITRDFGFAPNPFYGVCSLATCKPDIRKSAKEGDWILGVGGSYLKSAYRKCIYLMQVSETLTYQEYWTDPRFSIKKPARNGSHVQLLGDNIYHLDDDGKWIQEDSHHSHPDGTPNMGNLKRDTGKTDKVLISDFFIYFGSEPIDVDLHSINHKRVRNYTKKKIDTSPEAKKIILEIIGKNIKKRNMVVADPINFSDFHKRVNQETGKVE